MEHTLEHRIRERAYEIWHAHGRADGRADEYWLAAEREVLSSLSRQAPAGAASASPRPQKRIRAISRTAGQRSARSIKTKS